MLLIEITKVSYISALQQGFRKTCSGIPWVWGVPWGFLVF